MPEIEPSRADLFGWAARIYAFAFQVAAATAVRRQAITAVKMAIAPIGYWRLWPFALFARELATLSRPRILDVSSPKLLSLFLANTFAAEVKAIDLDDTAIETRWLRHAEALGLRNYSVEYQDARILPYPTGSFDAAYSISVIEHIPGTGDTIALREMARVVRPGGLIAVEVPYRDVAQDVMRTTDSKGAPLSEPAFYERFYDKKNIGARLVAPVMDVLELKNLIYMGEVLPVDPILAEPSLFRTLLLPLDAPLAAVNCHLRSSPRPLAAMLFYQRRL